LFGKNAEKISPEPSQMQSFGTLEHGPLAKQCPDQDREIQQTETIMYQNKVTLIGFLGSNPEARTNSADFSVTTLSLATKSSFKKDGNYISHTEWHRCVVFGKLSQFALTLTKGAHIQVEGELRSREFDSQKTDSKRRVWEIRVASILKLDRAEKAAPDDQPEDPQHENVPQEETAA
jgi:single-strand DNA-binding protein